MVTREQILSGVEKFVVNDVISKIQDRALCIILDTALGLLKRRPEMLDKLIDNPVFKVEGGYDVDTITDVAKESIKKLGAFPGFNNVLLTHKDLQTIFKMEIHHCQMN